MIHYIRLRDLRNIAFNQFIKDVTTIIDRNGPEALSIKSQYNTLLQKSAELQSLFGKTSTSPLTSRVKALSSRRNRAFVGLKTIINGYTYHRTPAMAEAGAVLYSSIKRYGSNITRENQMAETGLIRNLIDELQSKPDLVSAVALLNLAQWVEELKEANEEFGEKFVDRAQDYGKTPSRSQRGKRVEVMAAYQSLCKHLVSLAVVEQAELYTKTINHLNALIDEYQALLK